MTQSEKMHKIVVNNDCRSQDWDCKGILVYLCDQELMV